MDTSQMKKNGKVGVESERRRELGAMLRDLVKKEGRVGTARLLGVDRKTVRRAYDSGQLTDHMAGALERLLGGEVEVSEENPGEATLEERVERMEEDVAELRESVGALRGYVEGEGADDRGGEEAMARCENVLGGCQDTASGGMATQEGRGRASGAVPSVDGLITRRRRVLGRKDPELVTEKPDEDDPEVYGAAWPLVEEWRRLREEHPFQGKSLSWLVTQERLLVLELAMLEEHGLTLPPEKQPLRGFGRRGQTSWRHTALNDTRKALRKRRMLRRLLTLGLWRK